MRLGTDVRLGCGRHLPTQLTLGLPVYPICGANHDSHEKVTIEWPYLAENQSPINKSIIRFVSLPVSAQ